MMTYVNKIGNHSSGYTSFRYHLNPSKHSLEFGDNSENVLAVFVDATAEEGWWYEGGGIYRNVWFNKANKIHFEPNGGIYLPTDVSRVNAHGTGTGNVVINATIRNMYDVDQTVDVQFDIINPNGKVLKTLTTKDVSIKAHGSAMIAPSYSAENIELWSLENPALHTVNASINMMMNPDMEQIDFVSLKYGYRKAVFDVDKGLILNDKRVKMKGFCNHQDFVCFLLYVSIKRN